MPEPWAGTKTSTRCQQFGWKQKALCYEHTMTLSAAVLCLCAHFALWGWIPFPAALWGCMSPVIPHCAPCSPSLSASLTPFQPALLGSQVSPEACPARHETLLQAHTVFSLFFSPNHLVSVLAWEGSKIAQVPSQASSKDDQNVTSTFTRQTGLQKTTLDNTWNKTF